MKMNDIDWSLYAIIDKELLKRRDIQLVAKHVILGGAGIIQYRNKISEDGEFYRESRLLKNISDMYGVPLIINDRVDQALAVDANGVHLGENDLSLDIARKMIGNDKIIGASVKSYSDYQKAKCADYLGIGAIYPTKTKKNYKITEIELIKKIRIQSTIPIVGIGGITVENLTPVIRAGANGVAVISALLDADHIEDISKRFFNAVKEAKNNKN
ncbi:thiamine phosphate synthase [bacterium]|nr:thiamine phosphate synthase [bacterium]